MRLKVESKYKRACTSNKNTDLDSRKQHGSASLLLAARMHHAGQAAGIEQHAHRLIAGCGAKCSYIRRSPLHKILQHRMISCRKRTCAAANLKQLMNQQLYRGAAAITRGRRERRGLKAGNDSMNPSNDMVAVSKI
jgi:hypothetical protein